MSATSDQDLQVLSQHPSWKALTAWVEQEKDRRSVQLAKALISGRDPMLSPEYLRGYFHGMEQVVKQPGVTDARLQRELQEEMNGLE